MSHQWSAPLRPYVETHGADAVWIVGIDVLGYPPPWAASTKENAAVINAMDALEKKVQG
jgi:hypothetical protein